MFGHFETSSIPSTDRDIPLKSDPSPTCFLPTIDAMYSIWSTTRAVVALLMSMKVANRTDRLPSDPKHVEADVTLCRDSSQVPLRSARADRPGRFAHDC